MISVRLVLCYEPNMNLRFGILSNHSLKKWEEYKLLCYSLSGYLMKIIMNIRLLCLDYPHDVDNELPFFPNAF